MISKVSSGTTMSRSWLRSNHLMVDYHGTRQRLGMERTYPKRPQLRGVLGMENNKVGRRDSLFDRSAFSSRG